MPVYGIHATHLDSCEMSRPSPQGLTGANHEFVRTRARVYASPPSLQKVRILSRHTIRVMFCGLGFRSFTEGSGFG